MLSEANSQPDQPAISGRQVFDLYQTYGFPVELTEEILREAGISFDRAEDHAALAAERDRARAATRFTDERHGSGEFGDLPRTEFLAWTDTHTQSRVVALIGAAWSSRRRRSIPRAAARWATRAGSARRAALFVVDDTRSDDGGHIVHFGHVERRRGRRWRTGARRSRYAAPRSVAPPPHRDPPAASRAERRSRRRHQPAGLVRRPGSAAVRLQPPARGEPRAAAGVARHHQRPRHGRPARALGDHADASRRARSGAIMMFGEKYGDAGTRGVDWRLLARAVWRHAHPSLGRARRGGRSPASPGIGSGKRRIVAYAGRRRWLSQGAAGLARRRLPERLGARTPEELEVRLDAVLAGDRDARARCAAATAAASQRVGQHAWPARARDVHGVKVVVRQRSSTPTADDLEPLVDAIRQDLGSGVVVLGRCNDGRVPVRRRA